MEALLELVLMLIFSLFGGDKQSRAERRDRVRAKRRELALRRWLKKGTRRGPMPNIGITCPDCHYCLTGLTGDTCTECGKPLDLQAIAEAERHNAGSLRTRH